MIPDAVAELLELIAELPGIVEVMVIPEPVPIQDGRLLVQLNVYVDRREWEELPRA